ncbi:MAG: alpha/beta fold hydrolase [Ignavibacteriaceae bacterium]|nr:alpha/beta fold hydrolase [Ignavibacteriaceae bacterium]
MKRFIPVLLIIFLVHCLPAAAQEHKFEGNWLGNLNLGSVSLRIVLKISKTGTDSLKAVLNSPDQTDKDIPIDKVIVSGDSIKLFVNMIRGSYKGKIADTLLNGTWSQSGREFPLSFVKRDKIVGINRPQNPKKPYPYKEEEVAVLNKDANVTLAGTFTYPEIGENFPAVVLITGSGPQDRDEALMGHRPFLVLSDYLTRHGIAVLRCDDRGYGKSTGDFNSATSKDFATDALACVEYLKTRKEVEKDHIGLIGHSEGGIIAPIVANETKDVAFIVMMAGPGLNGEKILELQSRLIAKAEGVSDEEINKMMQYNIRLYQIAMNEKDSTKAAAEIHKVVDEMYNATNNKDKNSSDKERLFKQTTNTIMSPWFRFFLSYEPKDALSKLKIPVLALNGTNDLQVPPKENLAAIEKALNKAGNKKYKMVELPKLNHLFQTSTTGSPTEYSKIEETIAPIALSTISDWILMITKK